MAVKDTTASLSICLLLLSTIGSISATSGTTISIEGDNPVNEGDRVIILCQCVKNRACLPEVPYFSVGGTVYSHSAFGDQSLPQYDQGDSGITGLSSSWYQIVLLSASASNDGTAYQCTMGNTGWDNTNNVTLRVLANAVPSAPVLTSVQPVVTSNSVGLTVQWTPNTSERPITSYDVEYRIRSRFGKPRWELRTVGASTTTTTFDSLEQNTTYRVRVAATSDVGTGPPSAEKEATTFGVPSLDEVCAYPLPKPGSVRMAWTRANFTQPAVKLQSYSIQYQKATEQGGSAAFKEQVLNSTTMVVSVGDTVSAEVHGLNLGDVYDVKVALLTNAGIGEYSELVNVTTYPDSCSQCSEIRAVTFVMFQADRMKVSEEQSMVLVDVYRQGPMETPLTLRVKDIPETAKRGSDYLLQSRDVVFLNTDQRLEKTSIVVRIRNDEVVEQGSPESFTLVLYSDDVDSRVVFTVSELTITIKDDD